MYHAAIAAGIFFAGAYYERSNANKDVEELKAKVTYMESIDYKVESLVKENALHPEKVSGAFDEFYKKYLANNDADATKRCNDK